MAPLRWSLALACLMVAAGCNAILGTDAADTPAEESDAGEGEQEGDGETETDAASRSREGGKSEEIASLPLDCGDMSGFQAGAPWPTGGACNTRISRAAVPALLAKPKIKWRYTVPGVPSGGAFTSSPVIGADGTIYAVFSSVADGSMGSSLVAVSKSGKLVFGTRLPGHSVSSPSLAANGAIYVGTEVGVVALTDAGAVSWTYPLARTSLYSPAILPDGTIVTAGKTLEAIHPDGTKRWSLSTVGTFSGSVAVTPSGLLVASEAPPSGSLEGKITVVSPEGERRASVPLKRGSELSPLVAADGTIVAASSFGIVAFSEKGNIRYQASYGFIPDKYGAFMVDAPPRVWFGGYGKDHTLLGFDIEKGGDAAPDLFYVDHVAAAGDGSLVSVEPYPKTVLRGIATDGSERWNVALEQTSADGRSPALTADGSVVVALDQTIYLVGK